MSRRPWPAPRAPVPTTRLAWPTPTLRRSPTSPPIEAPVPAPAVPLAGRAGSAPDPSSAAATARRPSSAEGRIAGSPWSASKITAAGTIGNTRRPSSRSTTIPIPRSSSSLVAPSAAASPNTLRPTRSTACTRSPDRVAASVSDSRVPGAPPRTSIAPRAPLRTTTAVTPVEPFGVSGPAPIDTWPTRTPGTSTIESLGPGRGRVTRSGHASPPRDSIGVDQIARILLLRGSWVSSASPSVSSRGGMYIPKRPR